MHNTLGILRLSTQQLTSIFLLSRLSDPRSAAGSSKVQAELATEAAAKACVSTLSSLVCMSARVGRYADS